MKSKVSFDVTQTANAPSNQSKSSSLSPPKADHQSIELASSTSITPNPQTRPDFESCPHCKNHVDPESVLPENAKIPVPVSLGEKKKINWTKRQWILLATYSTLAVLSGFGLVGAFKLLGGMGIIYATPVFIIITCLVYCLTQSKREKKRQRNTIILRNCKSCRQRLHLRASVNNKIVE